MSHSSTSTLFPSEQTLLTPIVALLMMSMRKMAESMPLWTTRDTVPGMNSPRSSACGSMKEKMRRWTQSTSPMQFGPQRRMPVRAAISESLSCRRFPSGPVSAKPPDSMMTPRTPRAAQLFDRRGHLRGGDEDDGEVHRVGDGVDGGITGQAFDLGDISG